MNEAPLLLSSVARAYRAGELSPVEVTQACLDRIADLDGQTKAFATVTAEHAMARARVAQSEVRDDPDLHRPLLGIPIGVKDLVDIAGVPTGAGCDALADHVPATSATVWRRLEDAGAVLVGKTRTHELAYGVATPPTRNPHDTSRIPGGSSGGSAAALAAGMCLAAVGSDTAGSIRIPAGLCGVAGIKPTRDLCPTDGVVALSPTLDHVGPMTGAPQDLVPLLAAMSDTAVVADAVDLAGLRVGVARGDALLAPEVAAAFARAAGAVSGAGGLLAEVAVPSFGRALWHADRIIAVEAAVVHADLAATEGDRLWPETRNKLASASQIDGATYYRARLHMADVRRGLEEALAANDVLLVPGVACPAPAFGAESVAVGGRTLGLGGALCWNMAAANMAGLPSVALPDVAADPLPVGVQLIGRAGDDGRLLSVAAALAERLPGAQPTPMW